MLRQSREGRLLLAQIDHVAGETLGEAIEQLRLAGAHNVQLISTVTKKGRPGYVILVDVSPDAAEAVETVLVEELEVSGWHWLTTEHVYVAAETVRRELRLLLPGGETAVEAVGKRIPGQNRRIVPEHDFCRSLKQRLLAGHNLSIPLAEVKRLVADALNAGEGAVVDLRSGGLRH